MEGLNTTLEEFLELEEIRKKWILEYVDGICYHTKKRTDLNKNSIIVYILLEIAHFLKKKRADVFSEQAGVIIDDNRVKPDVFVITENIDKKHTKIGNYYITIPDIVFELVDEKNPDLDAIKKMMLYRDAEVKEYNLIYKEGYILQYELNDSKQYYLKNMYSKDSNSVYRSDFLDKFEMQVSEVFKEI